MPKGLVAVSNGALVSHRTTGARTTWAWRLDQKVSSYLVTATLGKFDVTRAARPAASPTSSPSTRRSRRRPRPCSRKLPAIVDYFSKVYGRYPFGQAGAIVDNAPNVGYALETATRPVFDRAPDIATLSHELAHQWFGDDVTLRAVARHLAQRGLRRVLVLALGRAHRRRDDPAQH